MADYPLHIAGKVSKKLLDIKLQKKYPDAIKDIPNYLFYIPIGRLESGRSGPKIETTLKWLQNSGIILYYEKKEEYNPYWCPYNPKKIWYIKVNQEWYYEYIKTHEKEPEFDLSFDEKDSTPKKDKDKYKYISQLNDIETNYLFNHWDEDLYDVYEEITTIQTKRYGKKTRRNLKIFPRNKLKELSSTTFYRKVDEYLNEQMPYWAVRLVLNMKDTIINKKTNCLSTLGGNFNYDSFNKVRIKHRIDETKHIYKYLEKLLPHLEEIYTKIESQYNGEMSDLYKDTREKFIEHLEQNAPLYIDHEDDKLKALANLVLLGKNKGRLVEC